MYINGVRYSEPGETKEDVRDVLAGMLSMIDEIDSLAIALKLRSGEVRPLQTMMSSGESMALLCQAAVAIQKYDEDAPKGGVSPN
jgi:hypothetical protein